MSLPGRIVTLLVAFLAVAAGVAFLVVHYLLSSPATVDFTAGVAPNTGASVNVVMQEAGVNTVSSHPDWVSYFIKSPQTGQWVHTTLFKVPAGTRVNMTVIGFDSCTPLRNNFWGQVTGTTGGTASVDGKPVTFLNSWSSCDVAHTFSIPSIGLNVPIASPTLAQAANPGVCSTAPCALSNPHRIVTFSFTTPRLAGTYFWQCRIPCGGGFINGFGGPMQTLGFMTGNMEVVS